MKNQINKQGVVAGLIFLMLLGFALSARADILYLKNGRKIEGVIQKESSQDVSLDIGSGVVKFSKNEIESIKRSLAGGDQAIRDRWVRERAEAQARAREIQKKLEGAPKQAVLDSESGKLTVETTLNKKVKADLVLDTGASLIVLSSKIAKNLGVNLSAKPAKAGDILELTLADGRKVEGRKIILDNVSVQGSEVQKVEAAILPEQDNSALAHDGLLGMSFLKNFTFKIDQKEKKLTLEKL